MKSDNQNIWYNNIFFLFWVKNVICWHCNFEIEVQYKRQIPFCMKIVRKTNQIFCIKVIYYSRNSWAIFYMLFLSIFSCKTFSTIITFIRTTLFCFISYSMRINVSFWNIFSMNFFWIFSWFINYINRFNFFSLFSCKFNTNSLMSIIFFS